MRIIEKITEKIKANNRQWPKTIKGMPAKEPKDGRIKFIDSGQMALKDDIILSEHIAMNKGLVLNNNILVIGGPGTGKSFNVMRPNLMQKDGSYIVCDACGELLESTGKTFERCGYDVRTFDLRKPETSSGYNPFDWIKEKGDAVQLAKCILENTEEASRLRDPFFKEAEKALLLSIIYYVAGHKEKHERKFASVLKIVKDVSEGKEVLDALFHVARRANEKDLCVMYYDIFCRASGKAREAIIASLLSRLAIFNIDSVKRVTACSTIDFKEMGEKPMIVYIVIDPCDTAYSCITSMFISQAMQNITGRNTENKNALPVTIMLDDFPLVGTIPSLEMLLATKAKNISCIIGIQSVNQLKKKYPDNWEWVMEACDAYVYLGNHTPAVGNYVSMRNNETGEMNANPEGVRIDDTVLYKKKSDECLVIFKGRECYIDTMRGFLL